MIFKFFVSNPSWPNGLNLSFHTPVAMDLSLEPGGGSGPILSILKISYSQIGNLPHIWVRQNRIFVGCDWKKNASHRG